MAVNDNQTKASQIPDTKRRGVLPSVAADDIVDAILRDHEPIKAHLDDLKNAELSRAQKEPIYEAWLPALKSHARAEEATLYVAMKNEKATRVEGFEGDTEHALAEQLIQEIHSCADDDEWSAKVKVLAESLEHHIEEEEGEMLPDMKAQIAVGDRKHLGEQYNRIKQEYELLNTAPAKRVNRIVESH